MRLPGRGRAESAGPRAAGPGLGTALGLSGGLLLWNNVVHALEPAGRWYVPLNLAATGALLVAARRVGLGREELGLAPRAVPSGLRWGVGVAALVAAGLGVTVAVPALRPLLDDGRIAGLSGAGLVAYALVRIPLGTVVLEETAFRGVLLAAWARRLGWARGAVASSVVFGLWHVRPSLGMVAANVDAPGPALVALAVGGSVALTTAAGLLFCGLRLRSGSLLAPVLAHVATNSLAAAASAVAQRLR